ncbi:hypothetical protein KM043_014799 [Ampulex compressa]|nr:hypothetical protein KM043_014799 [Ampulex compressa]
MANPIYPFPSSSPHPLHSFIPESRKLPVGKARLARGTFACASRNRGMVRTGKRGKTEGVRGSGGCEEGREGGKKYWSREHMPAPRLRFSRAMHATVIAASHEECCRGIIGWTCHEGSAWRSRSNGGSMRIFRQAIAARGTEIVCLSGEMEGRRGKIEADGGGLRIFPIL